MTKNGSVSKSTKTPRHFGILTADDGDGWTVLGDEAGGVAAGGKDNNGAGLLLSSSGNSGDGEGLGGVGGGGSGSAELVEEWWVADSRLREHGGLSHHENYRTDQPQHRDKRSSTLTSVDGVRSLGGLTGKHDAVGTVEDSVGDIANLSTGRAGVVLHFQI